MLTELRGNLFLSKADALVNTVNCKGVMGRGVALEFKQRYPAMFEHYQGACKRGLLRPGMVLPYSKADKLILNFAVKDDWRHPAKLEWIEACLERFVGNYERLGITSVAMPHLGRWSGQLPWGPTHALIKRYLSDLPCDVELIAFDPTLKRNIPLQK